MKEKPIASKSSSYGSGEHNLDILIKSMSPLYNPGDFVFCAVGDPGDYEQTSVQCMVREEEGTTIVVSRGFADQHNLHYETVMAWITLTVHSSLEAVGFTAVFSGALAKAGISCNVIAGFHHDHIFVPKRDIERALIALAGLSTENH